MKPYFSLRDLFWLILVVGLSLAWMTSWFNGDELARLRQENSYLQQAAGIFELKANEEQRATDAAALLLATNGYAWGKPINVSAGRWNTLLVEYATPPKEHQLVGNRAIRVHRDDWHATIVERQ